MSAPQKRPSGRCDALSQHLRAIGRIDLLSPDEEITLARQVQAGRQVRELAEEMELRGGGLVPSFEAWALEAGMAPQQLRRCLRQADQAASRMVIANLRLVVSMARRAAFRPADLEDLIQEGTIGLIRAVERFDPRRGYRFSTYAVWWSRTIRLPVSMVQQLQRLRQMQQQLSQTLGRDPSLNELAEALDLTPLDLRELLFRAQEPLSLDGHQGGLDDFRLLDTLACQACRPEERLTATLMRQDIETLLAELPPQEAELLRLRYGLQAGKEPLSLSAVARQMGITRDSARGLERRANASIRRLSSRIEDYLEA